MPSQHWHSLSEIDITVKFSEKGENGMRLYEEVRGERQVVEKRRKRLKVMDVYTVLHLLPLHLTPQPHDKWGKCPNFRD